jgi:small-conductance mechanosensitive channel
MDAQQQINLEIFKRFNELGIEFAFPTQTLHLEKSD